MTSLDAVYANKKPCTTYKVSKAGDLYSVTFFPQVPDPIVDLPGVPLSSLPRWMQKDIKMLDTAGAGCIVPHIGHKTGSVYWMYGVDSALTDL